jgi:hypothetical protein
MPPPNGRGLLGALAYHGLPALDAAEKKEMQALAAGGGPYTAAERTALTDYCQNDVDGLARLLPAMLPAIDVPRGLLRGRYTVAAARMEWTGTPLDVDTLDRLRAGWESIKAQLVRAVDADYSVFVPADPGDPDGPWSFSAAQWASYLVRNNIPWPRLESGALALDDDTFREMSKLDPGRVGRRSSRSSPAGPTRTGRRRGRSAGPSGYSSPPIASATDAPAPLTTTGQARPLGKCRLSS